MTFAFETELISAINKKLVDQKTAQKRDESQWKSTAEEAQRSRRQRKPNNTRLTNPITMSFGVFVWLISQNVACEAIFSCSLSLSFFGPCVFSSKSDYQFSWCKKNAQSAFARIHFFFGMSLDIAKPFRVTATTCVRGMLLIMFRWQKRIIFNFNVGCASCWSSGWRRHALSSFQIKYSFLFFRTRGKNNISSAQFFWIIDMLK